MTSNQLRQPNPTRNPNSDAGLPLLRSHACFFILLYTIAAVLDIYILIQSIFCTMILLTYSLLLAQSALMAP